MTGRVFGTVILTALWVLVGGAGTAQAALVGPTFDATDGDTPFNLGVEWIWNIEEEPADPAASLSTSNWFVELSLFYIPGDGDSDLGSVTATLQHLAIPHPALGEGTAPTVSPSLNFGFFGGIPVTDESPAVVSELHANNGNHYDTYQLIFEPLGPSQARIRITGTHPGGGPPVPAPSAAVLVAIGLGVARRGRRRRTNR